MYITRTIAEQVSDKMVEPILRKRKSITDEMAKIAYDEAIKTFPKDLLDFYKRHISYFNSTRNVVLRNGTQELYVELSEKLPCEYGSWKCHVNVGSDIVHKLSKMDISSRSIKNEYVKTRDSIISTLLSLKTSERVQEQYPEAYEYIKEYEEKKVTTLSLPIDSITATINKYK